MYTAIYLDGGGGCSGTTVSLSRDLAQGFGFALFMDVRVRSPHLVGLILIDRVLLL